MTRSIGMCTWIMGDAPLEEVATRSRRAGLDGVELFGDVARVDPGQAARVLAEEGLEVFSITPADADISHPDTAIRELALEYYWELMDFAATIGKPIISCHGQAGRIKAVSNQDEEDHLLIDAAERVCRFATKRGLTVVFEILSRYETHQIRTVTEGLALLDQVEADNLALLPDANHMNIEETRPAEALLTAGDRIGLYHAADSNRGGIGDGHTAFREQIGSLDRIGYAGPIVLEVNAPGPNPLTPDKGTDFRDIVESQLSRSARELRAYGT